MRARVVLVIALVCVACGGAQSGTGASSDAVDVEATPWTMPPPPGPAHAIAPALPIAADPETTFRALLAETPSAVLVRITDRREGTSSLSPIEHVYELIAEGATWRAHVACGSNGRRERSPDVGIRASRIEAELARLATAGLAAIEPEAAHAPSADHIEHTITIVTTSGTFVLRSSDPHAWEIRTREERARVDDVVGEVFVSLAQLAGSARCDEWVHGHE